MASAAPTSAARSWPPPLKQPSNQDLDHYAREHLQAWAAQTIEFAGLPGGTGWASLLTAATFDLLDRLTPRAFEALAATRHALTEARDQLERERELQLRAVISRAPKSDQKDGNLESPKLPPISRSQITARARQLLAARREDESQAIHDPTGLVVQLTFETMRPGPSCAFRKDVFTGQPLFDSKPAAASDKDESDAFAKIGGTFELVCSAAEALRLQKPLQLIVFAAIQLKLEAHWLRDIHCIRLPPLPPVTPTEQQIPLPDPEASLRSSSIDIVRPPLFQTDTMQSTATQATIASQRPQKWSRANLWGILLGKSTDETDESSPRKIRLRQSISRSLRKRKMRRIATNNEEWHMVEDEKAEGKTSLLQNMFERTATMPSISMPSVLQRKLSSRPREKPLPEAPVAEESAIPASRYAPVIARMQNVLLSTSAGVRFGPPHLLEKLRLQEIEDFQAEEEGGSWALRPVPSRQRSFPVADAEALAHSFAESSRPSATPTSTISRHTNRIAAEAKAGLASLTGNNASLNGMIRHQALQYLVGRRRADWQPGEAPCEALKAVTVDYAAFEADERSLSGADHPDVTVADYIHQTVRAASEVCPTAGCGKLGLEHVTSYTHNDGRMTVSVARADAKSPFEVTNEITIWSSCSQCGRVYEPVLLSAATGLMSFAKLIELILYDSKMLPESEPVCEHIDDSPQNLLRCFRWHDHVVQLAYKSVTLYELRMPTPLSTVDRVDDPPSPPHRAQEEEKEALRQDLRKLGVAVIERLEALDGTLTDKKALDTFRTSLPGAESQVLRLIRDTPLYALNDARYALTRHYETTRRSLAALEASHLPNEDQPKPSALPKPAFMQSCHALPAGNAVIARDDEPSSIIAFALSASIFRLEMAKIYEELEDASHGHHAHATGLDNSTSSLLSSSPSRSSNLSGNKPEHFEQSVSIERNEPLRQVKSLLMLGTPRSQDGLAARFQRLVSDPVSRPAEPESIAVVSGPSMLKRDDTTLLESLLVSKEATGSISRRTTDNAKVPKLISALSTPVKRPVADAPSVLNAAPEAVLSSSASSIGMHTPKGIDMSSRRDSHSSQRTEPGDSEHALDLQQATLPLRHQASFQSVQSQASIGSSAPPDSARSSMLSTLWTSTSWRGQKMPAGIARSESVRKLDEKNDAKRHVKYTFRDGDKRFTVVAWDAARFGKLRRQCGIHEQTFIDSLSRCTKWATSGGKSKSAFFMTADKRFVLKQMLDAWTGSERESMLAFSSDYFSYFLRQSDQRPSLIAKLFGVFSITVRDEKAGEEKKLDLVVMENLFYQHSVSHTFDLKGIAARVAKTGEDASSVMWDSSWISRFSNVVLVHAYSKAIISAAIANDCQWLAQMGIMDYSALAGVCDDEHTLVLGIIDVLGSFNLAKLIEHRAKSALRSPDSVTVVPPQEYADRFRKALASYIVAVPEKWTATATSDGKAPSLPCPL